MKFDYVSWEAFATILTGVLAVGAATFVGVRQHQTIQRQADIQALALNASLFDRRMVIVTAFSEHSVALKWHREAIVSTRQSLAEKSREVPFLFSGEVMEIVEEGWRLSTKIGSCVEAMNGEQLEENKAAIADACGLDGLMKAYKALDARFYSAVSPVMTLHAIR
ncbi:hypothetical protein LTR94_030741 [Friedmanniomyces endolithicus]|nr:hypothetical protein LTR94_030741 [Friedmanniomyces endolithicus]